MKQIMCVTGRQGTGKTTVCQSKPYHVLPGKLCREKFGERFFADKENPSCPEESERFVRECIVEAILKIPEGEVLWVDGFPRSPGQATWLNTLINPNTSVHVVFLTCLDNVRTTRLTNRDLDNPDAVDLHLKRELSEVGLLYQVLLEVHGFKFSWSVMDNTTVKEYKPIHNQLDKIVLPISIKKAIDWCSNYAKNKGWWGGKHDIPALLALMHSEISEALEDYRDGNMTTNDINGKPCGFPSELADVAVRLFDISARLDIDLEYEFIHKMKYNETRPYRHGNKKI